jgi:hypothetical protein
VPIDAGTVAQMGMASTRFASEHMAGTSQVQARSHTIRERLSEERMIGQCYGNIILECERGNHGRFACSAMPVPDVRGGAPRADVAEDLRR